MALKNKVAEPDIERFVNVKDRINGIYNHCGNSIRNKETKRITPQVFVDMAWLAAERARLPAIDRDEKTLKRLENIERQVATINREQRAVIATGEAVDASLAIFASYRFQVRELEKQILPLVDDETVELLTGNKLADENENRVSINLTDPDADNDADDPPADDPDVTDTEKPKKKKLAAV